MTGRPHPCVSPSPPTHAAVDLKADLRDYLVGLGHEVADLGPDTAYRVDYPDYGYCIAMGARVTGVDMAKACLDAFLSTAFGEGRHAERVEKLSRPPV